MGVDRRSGLNTTPLTFDKIADVVIAKEDKGSLRISKERRQQLKVIAALSQPRKSVFSLVDSALKTFIRRYELASGKQLLEQPGYGSADLPTLDLKDIEDQHVSEADRTSLAVDNRVREALKVIAALEEKTVHSIVDAVLEHWVDQFEAVAHRRIVPRARR